MVIAVYLPVFLSAIFGAVAPALLRRLPSRLGLWIASGGAATCALGLVVTVGLLGFTLVARTPLIAAQGGWSTRSFRNVSPVRVPVAATALVLFVLLVARLTVAVRRRVRDMRAVAALAAALPSHSGELVVIDDAHLQAWAVPGHGHHGRIVVSTALLRTLDADERRAVIAHERAHLRHHHQLHHTVAMFAAAADPFLWRMPRAVELMAERSADDIAARSCSRSVVANALVRASVGGSAARTAPAGVLGVASSDVVTRVRALRQPPRRPALLGAVLLAGLVALTVAAMVEAIRDTNLLMIAAQAWDHRGR